MNKLLYEGLEKRVFDTDKKRQELKEDPIIMNFLASKGLKIEDIDRLSLLDDYRISEAKCAKCKGLDTCTQKMPGLKMDLVYDGILYDRLKECPYKVKASSQDAFLSNFLYSDIPTRLKHLTLEDLSKQYGTKPDSATTLYYYLIMASAGERKRGFYIYGDLGVGKTYLSIAFINTMAKRGKKCAFMKVNDFINKMRRYIANHSDAYDTTMDDIKNAEYLIIDDLGTESVSAYSRDDLLFNILDHRMENDLFTIFTSNIPIDELKKVFTYDKNNNPDTLKANRLIERIRYLGEEYNLSGENKRLKQGAL